jgi:uncharacterized protein YkwD
MATITSVRRRIRQHLKLAVVPHKANQYRPHAVRRYGIAVIVLFVFLSQGIYNSATSGRVLGVETDVTSSGLLEATNQARKDDGEQPLILNQELTKAAQLKVEDMFTNQYWAHTSPSGVTPWQWFGKVGYSYSDAGENLAKNFSTSDGVIAAWLQSPTHRANMLKAGFKEVGFASKTGVLEGHATSIVVAMYGAPAEHAVQGATQESQTGQPVSFVARLGLGLQSLTPAAVGSIILLLIGANIALVAHFYRKRLPLVLRRGWYRHHGVYKAVGFISLAVVVLFMYGSGGQL